MMLKKKNYFFSVSLILVFSLLSINSISSANSLRNMKEPLFSEHASSFSLASTYASYPLFSGSNDGFFSKLFKKSRTVAEKNSQSPDHSKKKKGRYTAPKSNSQMPIGNSANGGPATTENTAVHNSPKEPLSNSRRNQSINPINKWEFGLSIGSSHAIADIGNSKNLEFGDFIDYQFSNLGLNFGIYTKYKLTNWFAASFGMDYGSYKGIQTDPLMNYAGYTFQNEVFEFFAKTELHAPFSRKFPLDLYAFSGIGIFFNDIRLFNELDRRVHVARDYSQVQPAIPLGLGFGYIINNKVRIGYELGYRYTFFNLFDGVEDMSASCDKYFSNVLKISVVF
jgi:hypothetical protein